MRKEKYFAIIGIKQYVKKTYGKKGDAVVNMNCAAIDIAIKGLVEVKYPESGRRRPRARRWSRSRTTKCYDRNGDRTKF